MIRSTTQLFSLQIWDNTRSYQFQLIFWQLPSNDRFLKETELYFDCSVIHDSSIWFTLMSSSMSYWDTFHVSRNRCVISPFKGYESAQLIRILSSTVSYYNAYMQLWRLFSSGLDYWGKRWGTEYKSSALALIIASLRCEGYWSLSVGEENPQEPFICKTPLLRAWEWSTGQSKPSAGWTSSVTQVCQASRVIVLFQQLHGWFKPTVQRAFSVPSLQEGISPVGCV